MNTTKFQGGSISPDPIYKGDGGTPKNRTTGGIGRIESILFPLVKHEYAQIVIPASATSTRYYFPELPNLRNVHLQNLEIPTKDQLPFSPDNQPIINSNLYLNTFLTLINYEGKEFCHQIPISMLQYHTNSAGVGLDSLQKQFVGQRVNWTKSYVEFSSSTNIGNQQEVVAFSIYYADVKAVEAKDARSNFLSMR